MDSETIRLRRSGLLAEFVREKRGVWNHADWLDLLGRVRAAGFTILTDAEVGRLLEEEKAAYREPKTSDRRAPPSLYKVLQVDPSADSEVIAAAYKRLARMSHPDINRSVEATAKMQELNVAYEVLSDPTRRAEYDKNYRQWRSESASPDSRYEDERRKREEMEAAWRRAQDEAEVARRYADLEKNKREQAEAASHRARDEAEAARRHYTEAEKGKREQAQRAEHQKRQREQERTEQRQRRRAESARKSAEEAEIRKHWPFPVWISDILMLAAMPAYAGFFLGPFLFDDFRWWFLSVFLALVGVAAYSLPEAIAKKRWKADKESTDRSGQQVEPKWEKIGGKIGFFAGLVSPPAILIVFGDAIDRWIRPLPNTGTVVIISVVVILVVCLITAGVGTGIGVAVGQAIDRRNHDIRGRHD